MLRVLSLMAVAAVLAMAPMALTANNAEASAKTKQTKICKHKTSNGKIKTWRCRADQPCCSAEMINYYTCGSTTLGCL
ncbi:hypothetical protein APY04_2192 [Hyphomicrobium sulfonivorans]|uniref:Uncharacterized protein n=1 Tax=Hyphomicrobium sulfonivorans TaxID=121290 RepID=A0A109BDY8_HYPSL|nr:hypothetical protein [Hyphomicrobium sulfonivorans]KWT66785.1 hypothetical protein APY04_2192 [Hyphomicrobium sulfonivorans]